MGNVRPRCLPQVATHLIPPPKALLGGFALLNFFLTYLLYNKQSLQQFLQYYSPDAMEFSRAYFTLTTFSVIAATARQVQRSLGGAIF